MRKGVIFVALAALLAGAALATVVFNNHSGHISSGIALAATEGASRGCGACHTGKYTLKAEAVKAASDIHSSLADDATVKNCLACHSASGPGKPFKTFLHFVHYNSPHFTITVGEGDNAKEVRGNCWMCHVLDKDGHFQLYDLVGK